VRAKSVCVHSKHSKHVYSVHIVERVTGPWIGAEILLDILRRGM